MTSNANCVVVNPAYSNRIGITANTCGLTLDLRVFIQGFYKGSAEMNAVASPSGQNWVCDTISVALINPLFPFNQLYVTSGVIDIYGFGMFVFPNAILNTEYYLVVRHRNSLEAWSSLPVYASVSITYDFTVSDTTAYGGNLADLGDGNFALWSGDISGGQQGGQDGVIDDIDLLHVESAALNFSSGYKASDITGDNMTELVDYSIIENNRNMLIIVSRP
jgi:hypothetical protein